ncbi:hypothetical protein [Streptosporangium sp. NPDC002607]
MRPELPDATAARAALDDADATRARMARHVVSPWWYYCGLGVALTLFFVSISFRWASYGAPLLLLAALGLAAAHKRSTGVVFRFTPGANRVFLLWGLITVCLVGAAMYLEYGMDVFGAHAVAGVVIGVLTVAATYRADAVAQRELRDGHDRARL